MANTMTAPMSGGLEVPVGFSSSARKDKKKPFFSRPLNVVLLVLGAFVVVVGILSYVSDRREEQETLQVENDMALWILNEAKLAEGEEIESITFDLISEKCEIRAVCGSTAAATNIYIKTNQRKWLMVTRSYPDIYWYYDWEKPYELCVGGETTDEDLCFNHNGEHVDKSTWTKTLNDIAVYYYDDFEK